MYFFTFLTPYIHYFRQFSTYIKLLSIFFQLQKSFFNAFLDCVFIKNYSNRGKKNGILDGVKGKISKAGYSTMQKAKDLSEITKLNMVISESETKINEIYSEIGYKVYCAYRENPLEEVKEEIGQIRELEEAMEACKLQIQAINAMNSCPRCGAKIKPEMNVLQQLWNETAE